MICLLVFVWDCTRNSAVGGAGDATAAQLVVPENTAAHQARDSHESYTPLLPEQGGQLLENNFDSAIAMA